jgi:hypothetical protein
VHPDVRGLETPVRLQRRLNGRKVYDDKRLDRFDTRRRRRSHEDRAQILRIVIRVIDAVFGLVRFDVMCREVAVNDIRVPAVMIPAWMEVLRRQERQARQAEPSQAGHHAPRQAVCHHNKIIEVDGRSRQTAAYVVSGFSRTRARSVPLEPD